MRHARRCGCQYCHYLKDQTVPTHVWQAEHAMHGGISVEDFPHPSGEWYQLICECGATHLTVIDRGEFDAEP